MTTDTDLRAQELQLHETNERTMLAWTRTAIALMAFGFAIARFAVMLRTMAATNDEPYKHSTESAHLGAMLVALGVLVQIASTLRYRRVRRSIEKRELVTPPALLVYVLGTVAAVIGIIMMLVLLRSLLA